MQQQTTSFFQQPMLKQEWLSAITLGSIFGVRMLGLFMVLPVLAPYLNNLPDATPALLGIAMGIYGLTQGICQMPFGMLSDHFGRKKIITLGLCLFIAGSILAGLATNMTEIIIGRALQGGGAIGSALIALLADLTREEHRSKAMAILGSVIGLSFMIALATGPLIGNVIGINGLFWIAAALGALCIILLFTVVPTPAHQDFHRDTEAEPAQFWTILAQPELLRLNAGVFILHMSLAASFTVLPAILQNNIGIPVRQHGYVYLGAIALAFIAMLPVMIMTEKKQCFKQSVVGAIIALSVSTIGLWFFHDSLPILEIFLFFFFTAFTLLEAFLPALVSRQAPANRKGTALGIYSSIQFFGIFTGGMIGGQLYGLHRPATAFLVCGIATLIWLVLTIWMQNPRPMVSLMLKLGNMTAFEAEQLTQQLQAIKGVIEAHVMPDDGIAYIKVNKRECREDDLHNFYMNAINSHSRQ